MPRSDPFLNELEKAVRHAGGLAQSARENLVRELKPDGSVVTNGDRETEEFLRRELERMTPGIPVWGEEFGFAPEGPDGVWVVDPVDGTTNYAFGSPLWGVTVGLVKDEAVVWGAVFLPDLNEMALSAAGKGAWLNGKPLAPIPPGPIAAHETVSYGDSVLKRYPGQVWPGKMRCNGSFVIEGLFMAQQRLRGLVGYREKLYDIAGVVGICRELGAEIRFADGRPMALRDLKTDSQIPEAWLLFPRESGFFLNP